MARSITPRPPNIQRGVISFVGSASSATATISAVNTANSQLRFLGNVVESSNHASLQLTSSTVITASRVGIASGCNVAWELTEFFP